MGKVVLFRHASRDVESCVDKVKREYSLDLLTRGAPISKHRHHASEYSLQLHVPPLKQLFTTAPLTILTDDDQRTFETGVCLSKLWSVQPPVTVSPSLFKIQIPLTDATLDKRRKILSGWREPEKSFWQTFHGTPPCTNWFSDRGRVQGSLRVASSVTSYALLHLFHGQDLCIPMSLDSLALDNYISVASASPVDSPLLHIIDETLQESYDLAIVGHEKTVAFVMNQFNLAPLPVSPCSGLVISPSDISFFYVDATGLLVSFSPEQNQPWESDCASLSRA